MDSDGDIDCEADADIEADVDGDTDADVDCDIDVDMDCLRKLVILDRHISYRFLSSSLSALWQFNRGLSESKNITYFFCFSCVIFGD